MKYKVPLRFASLFVIGQMIAMYLVFLGTGSLVTGNNLGLSCTMAAIFSFVIALASLS